MKIVIDDKIPFVRGVFEKVGCEVLYLPGEQTTPQDVKNASALMTRTRTICDEKLLKNSTVKIIATATIGYDHIDTDFCAQNHIAWTNAAGCNASGVEQYVGCALATLAKKYQFKLAGKTLGVVGMGHTGSRVAALGKILGMNVLVCDPPRAKKNPDFYFDSFDYLTTFSDIISFHVPLTFSGECPTFHQANQRFFDRLKKGTSLINASRGEVVETNALIKAINQDIIRGCVLDVWENEPHISRDLVQCVDIATPHIAGYSAEGKRNGTQMAIRSISQHLHLGLELYEVEPLPLVSSIITQGATHEERMRHFMLSTYDIMQDDAQLRAHIEHFEQLRGAYHFRRDLTAYLK